MKKQRNKKIGIIGGVGPQATQTLYGQIIEFSQHLYNAKHNDDFPYLVIESVPIPDFISDMKKIDIARETLKETVGNLKASGATCLAIASNTVHLLLDDLQKETDVPFISMVDKVIDECKARNLKRVGLLASPNTLKLGIYDQKLEAERIELIKPLAKQEGAIENMIRYYLAGKSNGKCRTAYINTLNNLLERGAEAIILGCTELPLVINYDALESKIIDSSKILANALTEYYYQKN